MAKQIPAYIKEDVRKLNNALVMVAKYVQNIENWVDSNTNVDGMDFVCYNHLDNPYEFDYERVLEELQAAVEE